MFDPQVHAEVEFELLEGAVLAVKTLNGLKVLGQTIKVALFLFVHFHLLCIPFALHLGPDFCRLMSNCVLFSRYRGQCVSQCWTWM